MIRILLCSAVVILAGKYPANGAEALLGFSGPIAGTLTDTTGQGTGFTVRLPGSGASIPANDPSLLLDAGNGHLIINSTRSDFNLTGFGRNLAAMESPAVLVGNVNSDDFIVRAKFIDIHTDQLSDQIGVFVGTSVDNVVRGGAHETATPGSYQAIFNWSQSGVDGPPQGATLDVFQAGDDGLFEIGRIGGVWHFSWMNTDSPQLNGSITNFTVPGIDQATDLYFGVYNHDARNTVPQVATLDYFQVLTGASVPEPSSVILGTIGLVILGRVRKWGAFADRHSVV
jgi:hypothetical protein